MPRQLQKGLQKIKDRIIALVEQEHLHPEEKPLVLQLLHRRLLSNMKKNVKKLYENIGLPEGVKLIVTKNTKK